MTNDKPKATKPRRRTPARIIVFDNGVVTITIAPAAGSRRRWPDDFLEAKTKTRRPF